MIKELLKDLEFAHSEFQQDNFIINKSGLTDYGKFKQSLREIKTRYDNLKMVVLDHAKSIVEMEHLQNIETETEYENKMNQLKIIEEKIKQENLSMNMKESFRELKRFIEHAFFYKNRLPELTDENKRELEEEFWMTQAKQRIYTDIKTNNSLSQITNDLIEAFPKKNRVEINRCLQKEHIQKLMLEFSNRDNPKIPEIDLPITCVLESLREEIGLLEEYKS